MQSERLRLFLQLTNTDYFSLVNYVYLTNETFGEYWSNNDVNTLIQMISEKANELNNNRVFVHPCPIDEAINTNYSFAGVYKSYKPFRCMTARENVDMAIRQLLIDRVSFYADYYYVKNHLDGTKAVDLFISCENDNICGYGTGYVDNTRAVFQYFDSPLSIYRKEAKKVKSLKKEISNIKDLLQRKILLALFSVQDQLRGIVDIEFVFDRELNIVINECRSVSLAHRRNWNMVGDDKWTFSSVASVFVNSVGKIRKKIKIWNRENFCGYKIDKKNEVLCVQYESDAQLFEMLTQLGDEMGISLVISYPHFIVDNHFSYVLFEDKSFDFILRCIDYCFIDGLYIEVESNGFDYSIKEDKQ